eukprot:TRINITY_DN858_c0_g1_i2.p1 TRINITY_DN858_c0_g1~~TRINITY_DN858_c0_g1_i2.p1  ORF type:complete len:360 (-),score=92.33 TRINITY_DN858_c0_g1_i2:83-1162(-)
MDQSVYMASDLELLGVSDITAFADVENEDELVVKANNIHKTYLLGVEGVPALRGVSLSIAKGEFVVIYGMSGGGKTTLMNIMGTIDRPTKGDLHICGNRINSNTPDNILSYIRLKKIGFVFQTFNLLSNLTAIENVELPMILDGTLPRSERKRRAKELLTMVGMGDRTDHIPSQLSGGEQQRVTIARSIANNPDILLLDEPTGDLDSVNTNIVMNQLIKLNQEHNITLIMVTHDVNMKNYANRVLWMRDGKIQRVDQISEENRNLRMDQLNHELENIVEPEKTIPGKNTFIRVPEDYKSNRDFVEREPETFRFQREFGDIVSLEDISQDEYERRIYTSSSDSYTNGKQNGESYDLIEIV